MRLRLWIRKKVDLTGNGETHEKRKEQEVDLFGSHNFVFCASFQKVADMIIRDGGMVKEIVRILVKRCGAMGWKPVANIGLWLARGR